jgi:esterase/lipase superfamily enzyme
MDDRLRLGVAAVRMGQVDATWDEICAATSGKDANPSFRLVRASEFGHLQGDAAPGPFVEQIDRQLAVSPNRQVNVYVHGFRTNFDWEVEVLAKLFHCSGRRGAMVCFSWPARQSLMLYGSDVERGRKSAPHLADLLELLATRTQAERINVLAYSCGATVVTEALVELRERHRDADAAELSRRLRIGNVILAASDIDLKTFADKQLMRIQDLSQGVVIYIAKNDAALGMANFGYGASRLGRPDVSELELTQADLERAAQNTRLQVVDVTDVPGSHSAGGLRGHGYWYANDWVMTDLLVIFRWQIPADERGLYRKPGLARWFFPSDYPEKVTASVRRLGAPSTRSIAPAASEHGAPPTAR